MLKFFEKLFGKSGSSVNDEMIRSSFESSEPNRAEFDGVGEENQIWTGTDEDWNRDN